MIVHQWTNHGMLKKCIANKLFLNRSCYGYASRLHTFSKLFSGYKLKIENW